MDHIVEVLLQQDGQDIVGRFVAANDTITVWYGGNVKSCPLGRQAPANLARQLLSEIVFGDLQDRPAKPVSGDTDG